MTAMNIPTLPESAPFSPEQRSWLNGYFAGVLGTQGSSGAAGVLVGAAPQATVDHDDDDCPWHDPAMPMEERLQLAATRAPKRRLMAAMAQLDCGACGYLCHTYAEAIDAGTEKDLTLCQPGGKATAMKLKELVAEFRVNGKVVSAETNNNAGASAAPPKTEGFSKEHPFPAPLISCSKLNGAASSKDTRFVALDLTGSGLSYKAGDALGIWPENCFEQVDAILRLLNFSGGEMVMVRDGLSLPLRQAMVNEFDISSPSAEMIDTLARTASDAGEAATLGDLLDDKPVDGLIENPHLIDLLARFPSARPSAELFVRGLKRIRPRLYSISSSPRAYPNEVHLTVGVVRYDMSGRRRKGVASTFLADRVLPRQPVRVYVHPSHGFAPPVDPDAPMIMVGPGTGIAPFRAFLQDRQATGGKGRNWLLFGDQREACDFLYRDELENARQTGLLTRLDTAFSRDSDAKVYVQHRMLEQGAELWQWLEEGAHFYVCGDAKRMAADVDLALHQIIERFGRKSSDDARAYVKEMAKQKRYQRDVY